MLVSIYYKIGLSSSGVYKAVADGEMTVGLS
ncbi:iron ABC transporter substrate-binding protein, partial [Streptococcus pneumoniae]